MISVVPPMRRKSVVKETIAFQPSSDIPPSSLVIFRFGDLLYERVKRS